MLMLGNPPAALQTEKTEALIKEKARQGLRVLAVFDESKLLGIIVIEDVLRSNVEKTVEYFIKQGVDLKIISGDSADTVAAVAQKAGVPNTEHILDLSEIAPQELEESHLQNTVFARAKPEHKIALIKLFKKAGRYVAMTGDGVNDVPALKESDCSIAMAQGSAAAREVSNLVLLNNDFQSLPKIVNEGRRTINNIERSASLFIIKTIYSMVLSLIFIFAAAEYPFSPIQMSLLSAFTIGLPSFVLALEPNFARPAPHFFFNIIKRALPGATAVVLTIAALLILNAVFALDFRVYNSIAVIANLLIGVMFVIKISFVRKQEDNVLTLVRYGLISVIVVCITLCLTLFGWVVDIDLRIFANPLHLVLLLCVVGFAVVAFYGCNMVLGRILEKKAIRNAFVPPAG
jgi:cation-transporting ATPase E